MTAEAFYLLRRAEPRADFRDLDAVVLERPVRSDSGAMIAAGEGGTVVAVLEEGTGYILEFSEPPGTLATVTAADLRAA